MNMSINGHHIQITDAMQSAVQDKLAKVERRFDHIQSIQVFLSLDNHHSDISHSGQNNHKAEAILRVAGHEMFVQACSDDMYRAIGEMADKLERQMRKYKTRVERKSRAKTRRARRLLQNTLTGDDLDMMVQPI